MAWGKGYQGLVHRHLVPISSFHIFFSFTSFHFLSFLDLLLICTFLDNSFLTGVSISFQFLSYHLFFYSTFLHVCASDEGTGRRGRYLWIEGCGQGPNGRTDGSDDWYTNVVVHGRRRAWDEGYPYRDLGPKGWATFGGGEDNAGGWYGTHGCIMGVGRTGTEGHT